VRVARVCAANDLLVVAGMHVGRLF